MSHLGRHLVQAVWRRLEAATRPSSARLVVDTLADLPRSKLPVTDLLFRQRYAFIVELASRRVVHVGVTRHPTDAWVAQQVREATPFGQRPTDLIRDNDSKFGPPFARVAEDSRITQHESRGRPIDSRADVSRPSRCWAACIMRIGRLPEQHARTARMREAANTGQPKGGDQQKQRAALALTQDPRHSVRKIREPVGNIGRQDNAVYAGVGTCPQAVKEGGDVRMRRRWPLVGLILLVLGAPGAAPHASTSVPAAVSLVASRAPQLSVVGNQIVTADGAPVVLHGVSRSGAEYACVNGFLPGAHDPPALFDGPMDAASLQPMRAWHITAVRLPLNEDCWLGLNGIPAAVSGPAYRAAIVAYVHRVLAAGLTPILTLHEAAPGRLIAIQQIPMPDADHSPAFWASVARVFGQDTRVVFDLFDEPFPDNQQDSTDAWRCWHEGGTGTRATGSGPCRDVTYRDAQNRDTGIAYRAASMQTLVDAVRRTGARNVLSLDGVAYADSLSHWAHYAPHDPLHNIVAGWHPYSFNDCAGHSVCWDRVIAPLAAHVPILLTEMGEDDCSSRYIDRLMAWADRHGLGYLAWAWNVPDHVGCRPNGGADGDIFVIATYHGTPFPGMGVGFKEHLACLASGRCRASQPTATSVRRVYPWHTQIVATTF